MPDDPDHTCAGLFSAGTAVCKSCGQTKIVPVPTFASAISWSSPTWVSLKQCIEQNCTPFPWISDPDDASWHEKACIRHDTDVIDIQIGPWAYVSFRVQTLSSTLLFRDKHRGIVVHPQPSNQLQATRIKAQHVPVTASRPLHPSHHVIGQQVTPAPLTRSKAQQNWNREVDQCPHEAEYLRHRAGRGHFWFTCLQCGGRWERTEIPSSSTTSASTSTVIQVKGSGSFPKYLPPPRSRPELPTHMVEVSGMERQKSKQMPIHPSKLRGRSADQMVGIPSQNTNTERFTWHCRELRVEDRDPSIRTGDDDGGRMARCDDVRPENGHRPRRSYGATLGRISELLSSPLVHSSHLSTWDEALARKVRSISHFAMMILLCTFACESRHMAPQNFDAINPEFDCPVGFPLWMSRPSHCLLRTENYLETPLADHTKVSQDTTKTTWKAAWLIPMTSSNQWLFQEDTSWNREPRAIPKSVKAFITQAVRDHFGTDIMEIYSPPRVTKEAQRQNDQRKHPPFRVGQAMDLTTGFDFRRPQDRLLALRRVRRFRPALLILCPPYIQPFEKLKQSQARPTGRS